MVNLEKIQTILERLKQNLQQLTELSQLSSEDLINDYTKINSAKYLLQIAIEGCISIGHHIIASEGFRTPQDYSDIFKVLFEQQIISENFFQEMQKMARFRNRLVHIYWEVDDLAVFDILQHSLKDFEIFAQNILSYLNLPDLNS